MKIIFYPFLILALGVGLIANAQTEKGTFLVGARTILNAGVVEHSVVINNVTSLSERITRFSLTPSAGYFVKNNLALGVELDISLSKTKDYDYDSEDRGSIITFSPFIRKYFGTKKPGHMCTPVQALAVLKAIISHHRPNITAR